MTREPTHLGPSIKSRNRLHVTQEQIDTCKENYQAMGAKKVHQEFDIPLNVITAIVERYGLRRRVALLVSTPKVDRLPGYVPRAPIPDRRPTKCQWIEDEPTLDDSCKCMKPVQPGSSYCQAHHARCYDKVRTEKSLAAAIEKEAEHLRTYPGQRPLGPNGETVFGRGAPLLVYSKKTAA